MPNPLFHPKVEPTRLALRPREAAAALGISERTLWTLTDQGRIPHVRLGRCVAYPVDALRKWLADQTQPVTTPAEGGAA
jgi:excisionase family DNA binding protein